MATNAPRLSVVSSGQKRSFWTGEMKRQRQIAAVRRRREATRRTAGTAAHSATERSDVAERYRFIRTFVPSVAVQLTGGHRISEDKS